ncbi:MAG: tetratricopeptide repeat protein [Pseudomonadota bacterium]
MAKSRRSSGRGAPKATSPRIAAALQNAIGMHRAGHLPEAEQAYRAIIQADPNNAQARHMFGVLASQVENYEVAEQLIASAIAIDGNDAAMHYNHAVVLQRADKLDEAIAAYRHALRLKPSYREAFENLGVALADSGDGAGARGAYENAIRLGDTSALVRHNLGALEREFGRFDEAAAHFERALAINPAYPEARLKLAQMQLASGDIDAGLRGLEWRNYAADSGSRLPIRPCPFPVYPGGDVGRVLVEAEQGVGDEVMFASCLPDLLAVSDRVVVQCDARLLPLFARSFPGAEFIDAAAASAAQHAAGPFDWRLPAGSLPTHFRREQDDFADGGAYLRADEQQVAAFKERLASLPGSLNIGLSWRGGADARARAGRSQSLKAFRWLLERDDCNVINLQYGDHRAEIEQAGNGLVDWDDVDPLTDLDGFASLVASLDLVVSVDNSTVHFAGALGVPTFVLVPATGEWRWMTQSRATAPWYSSLTLFHQPRRGDWEAPLAAVRAAVDDFTAKDRPASAPAAEPARRHPSTVAYKTVLLNDTSGWYHWGCSCTSIALHSELTERFGPVESVPLQRTVSLGAIPGDADSLDSDGLFDKVTELHADLLETLSQADRVIVNGEGTLHGASAPSLSLLYLAHLAKTRLGKHVEIINHSCYPPDSHVELYKAVYDVMDRVAVREPVSARRLRDVGIEVEEGFDCLPLFCERVIGSARPETTKRLLIAGCAAISGEFLDGVSQVIKNLAGEGYDIEFLMGAAASPAVDDFQFVELLQSRVAGVFTVYNATSEVDWLQRIASSSLLLSGRFHHSIAAAWMGTPLVSLPSNTGKIDGLLQRLGLPGSPPAGAVLHRVTSLLEAPDDGLISDATRQELLALARRNFAED